LPTIYCILLLIIFKNTKKSRDFGLQPLSRQGPEALSTKQEVPSGMITLSQFIFFIQEEYSSLGYLATKEVTSCSNLTNH